MNWCAGFVAIWKIYGPTDTHEYKRRSIKARMMEVKKFKNIVWWSSGRYWSTPPEMEREVQRRKVGYTPSWNSHSVENKEKKKQEGRNRSIYHAGIVVPRSSQSMEGLIIWKSDHCLMSLNLISCTRAHQQTSHTLVENQFPISAATLFSVNFLFLSSCSYILKIYYVNWTVLLLLTTILRLYTWSTVRPTS